jgi:DNA-binding response OmpR family regulator
MTIAKKKILCIEDDRETAALIAEELIERGYDIVVAHDVVKDLPQFSRQCLI